MARRRRAMAEINVVPYIDVMLVLLIIFMVAAPLINPGQIDLPQGTASGLVEARQVLARVQGMAFTDFTAADVVRHPLVARIVEAYEAAEPPRGRG